MKDRVVDTTVRIAFNTNDGDGAPVAPSSAFAASDFVIYKDGSATQKATTNGITVTSPFDSLVGLHLIEIDTSNDTGDTDFWALNSEYRVAINSAKTVDGVSQSGVIVGEFRLVSGAVELDSAAIAAVADAVLTESILDHRNVANSLAKYIWQIRQANLTIDGTVSNAITPTTLTFASNVVATTSAYAHAVLLFTTGPLAGENSPILTYNSTNGVFLLEEALTAAPSNGDEFVVIAGSHVHSVADIQSGLARTGADSDTLETLSDQLDTIGANVSSVASVSREAY